MNEVYVEENKSIFEAMRQIDRNARKILFVHDNEKLLASLTDGDIRRWILKKGDIQLPVKYAANYNPIYIYEQQVDMAARIMRKYQIDAVPVVDKNHIIQTVVFANDLKKEHCLFDKEIPIVIMAGGRGTRLSPYTNILPKPLIPIGDYPISEHIVNYFYSYGCRQFYMIVNYKRNMIKAYFDELDKDYRIDFIIEEKELGTGGGISLLKGKINDTFILTNCDILINDDLTMAYQQHVASGNLITVICSLKNFIIPYGVVNVGANGEIETMKEKPSMPFWANTGCYFVDPRVVENLKYNEPIDFPQIIEKYLTEGKRVGVYPIGEEAWLDMGRRE